MTEIRPENIVNKDGVPTDESLNRAGISPLDIEDVYHGNPNRVEMPTAPVVSGDITPKHPNEGAE